MTLCKGCGEEIKHEQNVVHDLCDWCYAEQRIAAYDEYDEADDRQQVALDESE